MSEVIRSFWKTKIAGSIAAGALDEVDAMIKPGVSTEQINKICYSTNDYGAYSPIIHVEVFKSCCTSTNHVVCHGIPSEKF